MTKCSHKWVDMEDGSLDKFCVRCRKFAMQAQMSMPAQSDTLQPASISARRETMEVPLYTGSDHIGITVDKENYLKDLNKRIYEEIGLPGHRLNNTFSSASR